MSDVWKWYAGQNEEAFSLGPFDTRADAINAGCDEWEGGFYIVEAAKAPVSIASYLDIDAVLEALGETIEEQHGSPDGGDPLVDVSEAEADSLAGMLRSEIQRWQELHDIRVVPWLFSSVRVSVKVEGRP